RRQAELLLTHLGRDGAWVARALRYPRVVVCAGHMIDQPGRVRPRFPAAQERAVARAAREQLSALDGRVVYVSAACGSDLLFLEAALDLAADRPGQAHETHLILPYEAELFRRDSVPIVPDGNWGARFDGALHRATEVVTVSPQKMELGGVSLEY